MRYELLLQAPPGATFDDARVRKALAARPIAAETVDVLENGKAVSLSLFVPLSGDVASVQSTVAQALEVAAEAECVLFDPQLSRALRANDAERVAEEFLRVARYAGRYIGDTSATAFAIEPARSQTELTWPTRLLMAAVVFAVCLFAAYLLSSGL